MLLFLGTSCLGMNVMVSVPARRLFMPWASLPSSLLTEVFHVALFCPLSSVSIVSLCPLELYMWFAVCVCVVGNEVM